MLRNEFDYEMDGLVIKINSIKSQIELGNTQNFQDGQRLFKFPSTVAETTIKTLLFKLEGQEL